MRRPPAAVAGADAPPPEPFCIGCDKRASCFPDSGPSMEPGTAGSLLGGVPNDLFATRHMREHNDANVIAFGARLVAPPLAEAMLDLFLETPFAGGRHERRVKKLNGEIP